ncbi:hypothetical protein [Propionicimonas sp.]|uniref:hypothetical protein n=1 Tax=Propionicimonas sp. TaxID=1955623 RepID=UPI002B205A28|nr:hypothetical protein [Propionicimonas sp.]
MVLGLLIAVLAVVFIAGNREPTEISLAVLRISAPLWVTLTGVFLAGLATGWLVARRRK